MSKRATSGKPVINLYEDDHYAAFFKQAGLLAVAADRGGEHSLCDVVNSQFRGRPDTPQGMKLHPCHRIDRDTSGIMVFAKGQTSRDTLMDMFRNKAVKKTYVAFVHGRIKLRRGEISSPIREGNELKPSLTRYVVLEQRTRYAIVEIHPETGRTNQIRIHFKEIGHPLVGENKFAFRKDFALKFKRTALHAAGLEFVHPVTGVEVKITAQLSTDMRNFLERNRQ